MTVYYNEIDKKAAAWLRELIAEGHIAPGDVDERSITDVDPTELAGYRQLHFFAGVGGWAIAARLAGWPDDREIVTGSCPCQPFSVAGKGAGTADARHLWPDFFRIIRARRPACVMGEQVAAAVGKDWLLGVRTDMEGIGYAGRGIVVPACAVNAPHRRDRLWFAYGLSPLVNDDGEGFQQLGEMHQGCGLNGEGQSNDRAIGGAGLQRGNVPNAERQRFRGERPEAAEGAPAGVQDFHRERKWVRSDAGAIRLSGGGNVSDALCTERRSESERRDVDHRNDAGWDQAPSGLAGGMPPGHWAGAKWLICHDSKARRVEPSIPLLVDGLPTRAPLLRGYGNAIVPQIAAEMMAAWLEEFPLESLEPTP